MNQETFHYQEHPVRKKNPLSTAAVILGILSLILCSVFYLSLPCGALAIICAILSRTDAPLRKRSKVGITCAGIGMIASVVITLSAMHYLLFTEEGHTYLQYYYQIYTGNFDVDVDDLLSGLFPFLSDSEETTDITEAPETSAPDEEKADVTPFEDSAPEQPESSTPSKNNTNDSNGGFI